MCSSPKCLLDILFLKVYSIGNNNKIKTIQKRGLLSCRVLLEAQRSAITAGHSAPNSEELNKYTQTKYERLSYVCVYVYKLVTVNMEL